MNQNLVQNQTETESLSTDLSPRQLAILNEKLGGERVKSIRQIGKRLGLSKNIVFEELKKIKSSNWHEQQTEQLKAIGGYAFITILHHLMDGKYEAAKDYMKGMNLYTDKLDVSGSIEQKLSDEEITDKAKQVILEVIQQAKSGELKVESKAVKRIELSKRQEISQDDKRLE